MNWALHYPTTDEVVLSLRERYRKLENQSTLVVEEIMHRMPQPMCRLCKKSLVTGPYDWTVCGHCYNQYNGKPPKDEE